jgi:6-phosphogluconolactonase
LAASHLHIANSAEEAARQASKFVAEQLRAAYQTHSAATFAISGGSTPKLLFADLAKADLDWRKVHVFWVDERCVPPTDDQSNYKLANASWFVPAQFPDANVHRILGELTPDEAAIHYIDEIQKFFGLQAGQLPEFDVIHRGMGSDAHTASLFPGEPLIDNDTGIAAAVWVEKMRSHRVTLLPGVLRKARATVLQVSGSDKAAPLKSVLQGPQDPKQFPCQIAARDSERAHWFLDTAAAAQLS